MIAAFLIDGDFVVVHTFYHANRISSAYVRTLSLPCSYEIVNQSTTAASGSMKQGCCTVQSEGGVQNERGYDFAAHTGVTAKTVSTTKVPLLSIRPKDTFGGLPNLSKIVPRYARILADGRTVIWSVESDASLTGATWAGNPGSNSAVENDTAATAISGGDTSDAGFIPVNAGATSRESDQIALRSVRPLARSSLTGTRNTLTIAAVVSSLGSGSAGAHAAFGWTETY